MILRSMILSRMSLSRMTHCRKPYSSMMLCRMTMRSMKLCRRRACKMIILWAFLNQVILCSISFSEMPVPRLELFTVHLSVILLMSVILSFCIMSFAECYSLEPRSPNVIMLNVILPNAMASFIFLLKLITIFFWSISVIFPTCSQQSYQNKLARFRNNILYTFKAFTGFSVKAVFTLWRKPL
jgi:hypothetical protein